MDVSKATNRTAISLNDVERAELIGILDQWLTWRDSLTAEVGPSPLRSLAAELSHELSP